MNMLSKYLLKRRVGKFLDGAVRRIRFDRDLWTPETLAAARKFTADGRTLLKTGTTDEISGFAAKMAGDFSRLVPPVSGWRANVREWLDVLAVVGAVAFGIRGLFLQPFLIPTGSMQPTLFGIHYVQAGSPYFNASVRTPNWLNQLLFSADRALAAVVKPGRLTTVTQSGGTTVFEIAGEQYRLPGEERKVTEYAGLDPRRYFQENTVLADGFLAGGDSLFVERLSHLFTGLDRGDIVVFNTSGLIGPNGRPLAEMSGYYYIKRLAGLPGDTLKISGGKLYIRPAGTKEFKPATEFSEKFEKIFSGRGGYHGYLNGRQLRHLGLDGEEFTVPADSYFMLGDNSASSLDSRYWGTVPRSNIVGKAFVVFWPFSRRWGLTDADAIPEPSGMFPPFKPMSMQ
ncbi:MAG: signal peptidase I [Victivallaceae bacterium]|nr:signal peptidase I [Victivallaceae bacterium]